MLRLQTKRCVLPKIFDKVLYEEIAIKKMIEAIRLELHKPIIHMIISEFTAFINNKVSIAGEK